MKRKILAESTARLEILRNPPFGYFTLVKRVHGYTGRRTEMEDINEEMRLSCETVCGVEKEAKRR
jgi:hypothetical protein